MNSLGDLAERSLPDRLIFHDRLVSALLAASSSRHSVVEPSEISSKDSNVAVLHVLRDDEHLPERPIAGPVKFCSRGGEGTRYLLTGPDARAVAHEIATGPAVRGAGLAILGQPPAEPDELLQLAWQAAQRSCRVGGTLEEAVADGPRFACEHFELPAWDHFRVFYQPQFSLRDDSIRGVEALVRTKGCEDARRAPQGLLLAAEFSGQLGRLTDWTLRAVCAQISKWRRNGGPQVPVSVNLSMNLLADPHLLSRLKSTVLEAGLRPEDIELELTERSAPSSLPQLAARVDELRGAGFRLCLDDLGTGFATVAVMKALSLDRVKIDRSYVQNCDRTEGAPSEAGQIVAYCHGLGLQTVAEGIERPGQIAHLRDMGCDLGQGFHWGPPLPPENFPAF
ncbi:MAG: EAL domain-containing protein [Pseudomonadota bacterium]